MKLRLLYFIKAGYLFSSHENYLLHKDHFYVIGDYWLRITLTTSFVNNFFCKRKLGILIAVAFDVAL